MESGWRRRYPPPSSAPKSVRDKEEATFLAEVVKPMLCKSLSRMRTQCRGLLEKCFTKEDSKQVRALLEICKLRPSTIITTATLLYYLLFYTIYTFSFR